MQPIIINVNTDEFQKVLADPEQAAELVRKNSMDVTLEDVYDHFGKRIATEEGKYCVYHKDGMKKMGTHDTKTDAIKHMSMVEATKRASGSKLTFSKNEKGEEVCAFEFDIPIVKMDEELREVTGIVYEPDVEDSQGDGATAKEIRKAAHMFYRKSLLGIMHEEAAGERAEIVESYIMPVTIRIGKEVISEGTWMMVVKVHDEALWQAVKNKEITGFSMGGRARVA